MPKIRVQFVADIKPGVTDMNIDEWLRYELGVSGSIQLENPLSETELEAAPLSIMFKKD